MEEEEEEFKGDLVQLSLLYEKDYKMEFLLKGTSVYFANLLRRLGIGQVPVYAIDKVTFYENSSSLFDEYIAHRIGQVPLISDQGKGSEILFTLEAEGPAVVFSKDLKSKDSKVKVAVPNIAIVKLNEGQNIRLEAKAIKGIGRTHGKFQAGLLSYEILSDDEFKFKVETFMQMTARDLLLETSDLLLKKCEELEEALKELDK